MPEKIITTLGKHLTRTIALLCLLACTGAGVAVAQIQFEDVSEETGMKGYTESWGGSWGDINNDNWPDIFNQGHREYPRMFRNTGEGAFEDIAYEVDPGNWMAFPYDDKHGASWVDYDNDGDDDLLLSVGSFGNAQFLVNTDGKGLLLDRAVEAHVSWDKRARHGVWFDFTNDGHLDVVQVYTGGAFLRYRDPDDPVNPDIDFDQDTWPTQFLCGGQLNYAQLIDMDGTGPLEIVCMQEGVFPAGAYDYSTLPFTNVTTSLPSLPNVNDSAVADFDGDLLTDMILTRGALRPSGATLVGDSHIEAWLRKDGAVPPGKGFTFESDGEITVTLDHTYMKLIQDSKVFVMDPDDLNSVIIVANEELSPEGSMSIEWEPAESQWRVRFFDVENSFQAYLQIDTVEPVTNLTMVDLDSPEFAHSTAHLQNSPSGLQRVYDSGLNTPIFCVSIVAGDFDNDMDQDLYMVCRRGVDNFANRLYENQGDGTFVEHTGHGAEGPVGAGFSFGVGESVVTADYDVDGFLDLYVTNGLLFYPVNEGGPENLFRNTGNDNHWLEIDLEGTTSNRDGVGAKVYVTAGGITQLREQNGGYHRWSQNHMRLHIGLADNTLADVTIEWPSGNVDNFTAVAADALYVATESGTMTPAVLGPPVYTEAMLGDECDEPPYDYDYGPVVLLWKDCSSGVWSLRAKGGRLVEQMLRVQGQIIADADFSAVAPVNLIATDSIDNSLTEILAFDVGAWFTNDKGFDFSTAGQTIACLTFDVQDFPMLILGGSKKALIGGIDLITLESCEPPPPPLDLLECGAPNFDNMTENALFVWRDCDIVSTVIARWKFALSGGGATWAPYTGLIESDYVLSAVADDIEPNDTLDTVPGDEQIDFTLRVGGSGIDSFLVDVPLESITCLYTDTLPAATPVLIGEDKLLAPTTDFNLLTLEQCDDQCHP